MRSSDNKLLRENIETLQTQMKSLQGEMQHLSIALKGSKALNITGIYERLVASEKRSIDCDEKIKHQLEDIKSSMQTMVSTLTRNLLVK